MNHLGHIFPVPLQRKPFKVLQYCSWYKPNNQWRKCRHSLQNNRTKILTQTCSVKLCFRSTEGLQKKWVRWAVLKQNRPFSTDRSRRGRPSSGAIQQNSLAWENGQADIRKYFYGFTQLTVSFLIPSKSILPAEGNSTPKRSMLRKIKPSSSISTDRETSNEKEEI